MFLSFALLQVPTVGERISYFLDLVSTQRSVILLTWTDYAAWRRTILAPTSCGTVAGTRLHEYCTCGSPASYSSCTEKSNRFSGSNCVRVGSSASISSTSSVGHESVIRSTREQHGVAGCHQVRAALRRGQKRGSGISAKGQRSARQRACGQFPMLLLIIRFERTLPQIMHPCCNILPGARDGDPQSWGR